MQISLKPCKDPSTLASDCLVVVCNTHFGDVAKAVDQATEGTLSALIERGDFKGKVGSALLLPVVSGLMRGVLKVVSRYVG